MNARDTAIANACLQSIENFCMRANPETFRAELEKQGYVVEQGWQDIADAPSDGTPIVLIGLYPDGVTWSDQYQCWWHKTMRLSPVVTKDGHWARWPHTIPPTHFRPLPAPPAQEPQP